MKKTSPAFALILLSMILPLSAADKPASTTPAAVAPAAAGKIYAPKDLEALRAVKGQNVTIEGTILKQGESKTGTVRYLNFTDDYKESVALVFMVSKGGGDFTKEKLTNYVGKKVQVTGAVGEYKDNLQIEVRALDQLKLVP